MARYAPELITHVRHRYEQTDDTLAKIATDCAISERTVNRWRDRDGWARRSERVRDVPPAMRALQEATALLARPVEGAANCHSRESGNPVIAGLAPSAPPGILGPRFRGDDRPGNLPAPSAIERIERLVEKELAAEEAVRAQLGPLPRPPADAERGGRTPDSGSDDDDDIPRDIDEFRRDLARRIDAFVASRTEPRPAQGNSEPAKVDHA